MADPRRIPPAFPGMRIGLFGGSFNPPHEGHRRVSEFVLRRARLDRIWWIVTPGNPLKDHGELAPLGERLALCRAVNTDPRIEITAFEAAFSVRYTADTLDILKDLRPGVRFVWIMGADNLAGFHRWQDWRGIAATMPMIVVDRPGSTHSVLASRAAIALAPWRVAESRVSGIAAMKPPAWTFLRGLSLPHSSTAIRAAEAERRAGRQR